MFNAPFSVPGGIKLSELGIKRIGYKSAGGIIARIVYGVGDKVIVALTASGRIDENVDAIVGPAACVVPLSGIGLIIGNRCFDTEVNRVVIVKRLKTRRVGNLAQLNTADILPFNSGPGTCIGGEIGKGGLSRRALDLH